MAEVLLFHHAQGLTAGVLAFADELRAAGHVVHTPDLYGGRTFETLPEGIAHVQELGFGTILERGQAAAEELPDALVYAGFSLGVMPAQLLTQKRPGARGAVLLHGCVPPSEFGGEWPAGVPVQVHMMEDDPEMNPPNGMDLQAARDLAAAVGGAELYVYPGDGHLFTDPSLGEYDEAAATQVRERVHEFLAQLG
jgi:dienelactone hydrolase